MKLRTALARRGARAWGLLLLLGGSGGTALLAFAAQFLLVHALPVADYGRIASLLAWTNLVAPLAGLTLGWFWLELYGREGRAAARWGAAALRLSALTLLGGVALLALVVAATEAGGGALGLTAGCVGCVLIGQALGETRAARLQLEERHAELALWQMATQTGRCAAVALLLAAGAVSRDRVLLAYAAVALALAAACAGSLRDIAAGRIALAGRHGSDGGPRETPGVGATARAALPYAMVTLCYVVYSQGIVAMVEALLGREAAAYYNVSYLVFAAIAMLPGVIYLKYLVGKLLRWWSHDRERFIAVFHLGVFGHLVLGVVLGLAFGAAAPWLVPLLFGPAYGEAVPVLQVLALAIPLRFVQHGYGSVLFAKEHVARKVRCMALAALTSALAVLALVPAWGVRGAAVAAVASELVLLLLYARAAARHVDGIDVRATFRWKTLTAAWARTAAPGRMIDT